MKTAKQMKQGLADAKKKRKAERVTVRELIELLAKCDWDSKVVCISNRYSEMQDRIYNPKELRRKIVAVSSNTTHGTQILFEDD